MEIRTFKDLKDFLGTLNEDQLSQRAFLCVDDETYDIGSGHFNDYACVYNEDMIEGNIPVSEYDPEDFDGRPLDHEDNIIYPIGSIVILSDI